MAIIQKIAGFFKKRGYLISILNSRDLKIQKINPLIILSFLIIFSSIFFISSNLINVKNKEHANNLKEITETSEFSNLTNYLISKINSPYEEISYVIENNDSVEKILNKFKIRNNDIKKISAELKQLKLANIYSGRKLSLIFKKLDDGSNTVINFVNRVNKINYCIRPII